jgi:hypothetical protein
MLPAFVAVGWAAARIYQRVFNFFSIKQILSHIFYYFQLHMVKAALDKTALDEV